MSALARAHSAVSAPLRRFALGLGLALAVSITPPRASATEHSALPRDPAPSRPSLHLNCPAECFEDYLKQELNYFDFSRDPHAADLGLLVVRQPAGSGGERFTVTSIRADRSASDHPNRSFTIPLGTPAVETRRALLNAILRLLHEEFRRTEHESAFELRLPRRDGAKLSSIDDPWDYWVIAPELKGEGEGGSNYYFTEMTGALTVRRVTEPWKLRLRGAYTGQWSGYRLEDGSRVQGDVGSWDARALAAHAVGSHWALGGVAAARGSEFENLEAHVHGGALVEFNVFPYTENASQQLRLAYQIGAWSNFYLEETVRGLFEETKPYHALSLVADVNQRWGSVQWIGQVNQFVDEPELYRLSAGVVLAVRPFEGISVAAEGEMAAIYDLIQLRERTITDEEILLWTAQSATDYVYEISLSLTYTFGSIHNTIVNPRFARVDLDED